MLASHEPRTGIVDLPSAGLPADHGLASLGLLMQLAGRTSAALAALIASAALLDAGPVPHAGLFWLAIALCFARSQLHRIAGRDLTYSRTTADGTTADPFAAMRNYIRFAIGHAVAIGFVAADVFDVSRP